MNKQLSNPSSTGGAGHYFEACVQASFVALMLTGGVAPCLSGLPIKKIKLQGRYAGYEVDDLIVFTEDEAGNKKHIMLGQIKESICITKGNTVFGEVIQSAWNDFNNSKIFAKDKDVIALITGPLSTTDIRDTRVILDWARHSEDAKDFFRKVELAKFSSQRKRNKLHTFQAQLKKANDNREVSSETVFEFLKHFHILGYDMDIKAGVILSLLHSLIGQYSPQNTQDLWAQLIVQVQEFSKNAGTITLEALPDVLQAAFKERPRQIIPPEFALSQLLTAKPDWNNQTFALALAIANLLGSWNEHNPEDKEIVTQIAGEDYAAWIIKIREILQWPDSPISHKNGIWKVAERAELWQNLGSRLFDGNLDLLKHNALVVLKGKDPKFELPQEDRFSASIYGKVLKHSSHLRKGIAEGLALLGSHPGALTNCSLNKPEVTTALAIREIFANADWELWGSLNDLLPLLAEASPDEFLDAVEAALQKTSCPFDDLFAQEGTGITGGNYLTGLLWALETLAWDDQYIVRVSVILGDLAIHDPGGNWVNRPSNSLMTIFLSWFPQTFASIDKRKAALRTLQNEVPGAAWKLLLGLLPSQHQWTSGSHKPVFRNPIAEDWKPEVSTNDYWDQVTFYSDSAIEMAKSDFDRLIELIEHLDNLHPASFNKIVDVLSSEEISAMPDEERTRLWACLSKLVAKHRHFANAKWALDPDFVSKIDNIAQSLAPSDLLSLHVRLFSWGDLYLYEGEGNTLEQQERLEARRREAIRDILDCRGIDAVVQLAERAEWPFIVGRSLGSVAEDEIDKSILPIYLENENPVLTQFISGYVRSRFRSHGWVWVDNTNLASWSQSQKSQFLAYLPFTQETWKRANALLCENEVEYWRKTEVNPYDADGNLTLAINKLIEFCRPKAAIDCLYKTLHDKLPLDKARAVQALLSAVSSSEHFPTAYSHQVIEIIIALQNDPETNPEDLFRVEWAYLPLLDSYHNASPKLLENRLASDPNFFCEVIRFIYRSKNEDQPRKEPTEQEKAIATNAYRLLQEWSTPPGTQPDGCFSEDLFKKWLDSVKQTCAKTGHLEVALLHIGEVLIHCRPDPDGLWINRAAAEALNSKDAEDMRSGFRTAISNSRGVYSVNPTGKPERELAEKYSQQAEVTENAGFQRLAVTLRELAESYKLDAKRIIDEHKAEETE